MKVGDLVKYISGSQMYFHFPSNKWEQTMSGTVGVIAEIEKFTNEKMYGVLALNKSFFCWFYEDELEILSKVEQTNG